MVPLYPVFNGTPKIPPGYMAYRGNIAACAPIPTGMNPGGKRHAPYDRAPGPRPFTAPLASTAVVRAKNANIRGSPESYSRFAVAAMDAKRHQSLPPNADRREGCASGRYSAAVTSGEVARSRRLVPAQHPYSHRPGSTARSVMKYREGGRDQGYHVGGGTMGPWQQYQQQPVQRKAHDSVSIHSTAPTQTEAQAFRRGVSGRGAGSTSGWG